MIPDSIRPGDKIVCLNASDEFNLQEGETYTVYAILRLKTGQFPGWGVQLVETHPHCEPGEDFDCFDPARFRRAELPESITGALKAFQPWK